MITVRDTDKLRVLFISAVTRYDERQSGKRSYNRYALPQYLARVDGVIDDIKAGADPRGAIVAGFNGRLADAVLKAAGLEKWERADETTNWTYKPVSKNPRPRREPFPVSGYPKFERDTIGAIGPLNDWNGNKIGTARIVSSWATPKSYVSSRMYQIEATIDGVRYTGRGAGSGMVWGGRPVGASRAVKRVKTLAERVTGIRPRENPRTKFPSAASVIGKRKSERPKISHSFTGERTGKTHVIVYRVTNRDVLLAMARAVAKKYKEPIKITRN